MVVGISFDLNGDNADLTLQGAPDEYAILRFDGLAPLFSTSRAATGGTSSQIEEELDHAQFLRNRQKKAFFS